jgi:hypothetical protein
MTLLEVVVALTVAGAALAAGAAVLGFLSDEQMRSGAQAITSASAVRTTIRDWTADARLYTEGDAEFRGARHGSISTSLMEPSNSRQDDELTFVTVAATQVSPSATQVHIHVLQSADSTGMLGLVADLTPFRRPGAPLRVSLMPYATGFRARYLGSAFGRGVWQQSWISTSVLPAAVELRVLFDSSARAEPTDVAARALLAHPMTIVVAGRR